MYIDIYVYTDIIYIYMYMSKHTYLLKKTTNDASIPASAPQQMVGTIFPLRSGPKVHGEGQGPIVFQTQGWWGGGGHPMPMVRWDVEPGVAHWRVVGVAGECHCDSNFLEKFWVFLWTARVYQMEL